MCASFWTKYTEKCSDEDKMWTRSPPPHLPVKISPLGLLIYCIYVTGEMEPSGEMDKISEYSFF